MSFISYQFLARQVADNLTTKNTKEAQRSQSFSFVFFASTLRPLRLDFFLQTKTFAKKRLYSYHFKFEKRTMKI